MNNDIAFDKGSGHMDASQEGTQSSQASGNVNNVSRRRRNTNLVLAALCLVAAGLVFTTFFLLQSSEKTEFETAFKIFARETAVVAEMHAENVFGQLQSLASAVRSGMPDGIEGHAHEISIPDFDLRTEEIANLTSIELLMFIPFVPLYERKAWEEFQLLNQEWILDGYDNRGWNTSELKTIPRHVYNYTLPEGYNDTRRGYVDDGFMEEILANYTYINETDGCSVPVAQVGPRLIDTTLIMMDLFTHPIFKKEIVASLEYDVPVISEVEDLEFLLKHIQPTYASSAEDVDYSLPRSFTLDQVKAGYGDESITVGFVVGVVQWSAFFRNFLPENINGIIVNVTSDCGKSLTYVVNGGRENEWYLDEDEADLDRKYQHLEQRYKFFWKEHPKGTSRHCHFDLLITPSEEFAQNYLSEEPILIAGVVLAVFMVAGAIFFLYDYYNDKRQKAISLEKARAESVVASLFPKQIGARLMEEQSVGKSDQKKRDAEWQTEEQDKRARPLADLFPSATILFADIAGFTAWSSNRDPTDVFTLLETIYREFDSIAKRRRVFKIETIGDCYLAVCGLPAKRDNHAVVMARFANNCLDKFRELVTMLDVDLPGTAKLQLRTGLHSGPVVGGVLRGDRARFQLFGDSVNTASRVESTGEGGRIHISQEFANELNKFGKSEWVLPRADKVEAKGKGTLTTYWLQVVEVAGRRSSIGSAVSGTVTETVAETMHASNSNDSSNDEQECWEDEDMGYENVMEV